MVLVLYHAQNASYKENERIWFFCETWKASNDDLITSSLFPFFIKHDRAVECWKYSVNSRSFNFQFSLREIIRGFGSFRDAFFGQSIMRLQNASTKGHGCPFWHISPYRAMGMNTGSRVFCLALVLGTMKSNNCQLRVEKTQNWHFFDKNFLKIVKFLENCKIFWKL